MHYLGHTLKCICCSSEIKQLDPIGLFAKCGNPIMEGLPVISYTPQHSSDHLPPLVDSLSLQENTYIHSLNYTEFHLYTKPSRDYKAHDSCF